MVIVNEPVVGWLPTLPTALVPEITGESNVNRPDRLVRIALTARVASPRTPFQWTPDVVHWTLVADVHEVEVQSVVPKPIVGVRSTRPNSNPVSWMKTEEETPAFTTGLTSVDITGELKVNLVKLVPLTDDTVKSMLSLLMPLHSAELLAHGAVVQTALVPDVHAVVAHWVVVVTVILALGVGSEAAKLYPFIVI